MTLSLLMVGVKSNFTPKGRNVMVTAPTAAPPCTTGKGNSPPERKLAFCPFKAKRLGSARICSTDFVSRSLMEAPTLMSGRKTKRFKVSLNLKLVLKPPADAPIEPATSEAVGGPNCCVVTEPGVFRAQVLKMLTP